MRTPWWYVGRWQAFVAALLMALSFLTVWLGMTYSYTLTNYTVHEPGEKVTKDGITYEYLGMLHTRVGTGSSTPYHAPPGITYVVVVVEVTIAADSEGYCNIGLTNTEQNMSWSGDQSHVIPPQYRMSCSDIPRDEPTQMVTVLEVPTSQVENIGGVLLDPSSWRGISEVIR